MGYGCASLLTATGVSIWAVRLVRDTLTETRRGVAVTEDMGKRQTRAYVNVTKVTMKRLRGNEKPIFTFTITNSGSSPGV